MYCHALNTVFNGEEEGGRPSSGVMIRRVYYSVEMMS